MFDLRSVLRKYSSSQLQAASVILLLLLALFSLWFYHANSAQAMSAIAAQVYFDGEYRIADGAWEPIEEGKHIPSTQGDVTLRGNFHMQTPDGEYVGIYRGEIPIALYIDHISLTFYEVGQDPFVIDMENPLYGSSVCGVNYEAYFVTSDSEDEIEILIRNPHRFGNETAIDELLSRMALWTGIDFEKDALRGGEIQRNIGVLLMFISIVFLGIALFSTLIHIKHSRIIWLIGLVVLFAGSYFSYSADGVSFWNDSIITNTTLLGFSMMFYMLFLSMIISFLLKETKKIGNLTLFLLTAANAVFVVLPLITKVFFYDTLIWWIAVQTTADIVLSVCLIREFITTKKQERWIYPAALLPLIAFSADVVVTMIGIRKGGMISQYVFIVLFVIAMVMVLKLIPHNINAAAKAKELEVEKITLHAQLAESRIATMMSQIRPHFIYNTLGSIEQLCKLDPPRAGELVHNFAKYLRGNFRELDNPKPILMSQEMEHVHHYISIENVRFPDMTFTFEINSDDFRIPALTVQPIVENAIKHGLMKLAKGGTIRVVSFETDTDYCISVVDDGVGFDTSTLFEDRNHVGLRNIRERLRVMVNGTLTIESTPGVGTKVLITIPKEGYR